MVTHGVGDVLVETALSVLALSSRFDGQALKNRFDTGNDSFSTRSVESF